MTEVTNAHQFLNYLSMHIKKQYGLFGARSRKTNHPLGLGMAERKILIVLCYYVVVASFSLTQYTVVVRNLDAFDAQLEWP